MRGRVIYSTYTVCTLYIVHPTIPTVNICMYKELICCRITGSVLARPPGRGDIRGAVSLPRPYQQSGLVIIIIINTDFMCILINTEPHYGRPPGSESGSRRQIFYVFKIITMKSPQKQTKNIIT